MIINALCKDNAFQKQILCPICVAEKSSMTEQCGWVQRDSEGQKVFSCICLVK